MNIFHLLLLLLISTPNLVKTHRAFYYEKENDREKENEQYYVKAYFPGKSNEDDVKLKHLYKSLSNNFINETNSNRIDTESDQQQLSSSRDKNINREKNPSIGSSSSNIIANAVDHNTSSSSFIKRIVDKIRHFNKESDEGKTKSSSLSPNAAKQNNHRIPPPSVMASASEKSKLRVCEIKYAEYIQRIFPQESDTASDANDAELNGRVLAAPGEYPHMTALGFRSNNGKIDYKCGGSLISETFVITAAHCTNFTGLQPTKVRIGDLNLMIEESYLEPQIRAIKNIYVHPDYRKTSYYNDIALLELEKEVHLTEFVRPIRLWTEEELPFTVAYAMGYGATDFARERTNRLTNLNMTIVPNDECNRLMPQFPETERGIISSQICAKDYVLNRDTCQGDSGGPLQLNIRGRRSTNRLHYQLIGITSYGLYCRSGSPSIFTRVCSYLDWIERIVWKDYFE